MEKLIYDESNRLWYELQGGYYLPCLTLPTEEEHRPIGIWGQRHLRYIKLYRRVFYANLLTSGKLNNYLTDLTDEAEEMFSRLVKQMAEKQGITETLKVSNQMAWVGMMNAVKAQIEEMIFAELIYY